MCDGRACAVTGAGRGIGRAHVEALAAQGARVVVNDVDGDVVREVVDTLRAAGREAVGTLRVDTSGLNFARINDPLIDKALDEGRVEADPARRRAIYERIARQFGSEVWNIWLNYTPWAVALSPDVHGIQSMDLPDDGGGQFTGRGFGHPLAGMWRATG